MLHYDGPAFYRKFMREGAINKTQKVRALKNRRWSKHRHQHSTFNEDTRPKTLDRFKPTHQSYHVDLQNNPIAKITAAFQPKRNYLSPGRYTGGSELTNHYAFSQLGRHYQSMSRSSDYRSQDKLRPDDHYFTRAASGDLKSSVSSARINSNHSDITGAFRSIPASVNNFQDSGTDSSAKVINQDSRIRSSSSDAVSGDGIRSDRSFNSELIKPSQSSVQSSSKSSVNLESWRKIRKNSSKGSSSTANSSPLGQNLNTIMNDKNNLVKNSPLFDHVTNKSNESNSKPFLTHHHKLNKRPHVRRRKLKYWHQTNRPVSQSSASGSRVDNIGKQEPRATAPQSTFTNLQNPITANDSDQTESHHKINHRVVTDYHFPGTDLLNAPQREDDQGLDDWILRKAEVLNKTLKAFKVDAQVVDWTNGPTVTQFQVKLHLGVKVSKIRHLSDDLKMALAAKDIRIEAPIPGKTTCGIEIPNPRPRPVMLSEVVDSRAFQTSQSALPIALGVDLSGHPRVTDLSKMPHGLIAGATGSGKSVFINSLLISLLYKTTPEQLRMILIDPKAVELAPYNKIPHLLSPVISEPKQAAAALKWTVKEMNQRYDKLAAAKVRNIKQFNQKAEQHHQPDQKMPYILIVIDELADLMMVASDEVETYIVRITQKARAAGIHLIVATQRPSVDIVTGTIKNNIPTRVAFMVSSQVDSRTIIDTSGAERLLGKGDMLYLGSGQSHPIRLQGCFVSSQEVDRVTDFVRNQEPPQYAFQPGSLLKKVNQLEKQDKLMPQVLAYIAKEKTISTSKLQRVFSIGYNRASKLIDALEQHNYISGQQGSKPRDVYLTEADYKKLNF